MATRLDKSVFPTLTTPELLEQAVRLAVDDPSGQAEERWEVVRELHARGEPMIFERAVEWCASDRPLERALGADVLAQLGAMSRPERPFARQSTPILGELLADGDPRVLASALFALGHLKGGDSTRIAALALHSSSDVRHATAFALGGRDEPVALQALILLTADGDSRLGHV